MSVAKRYKNLNLSGDQCFALLRSLCSRETILEGQLAIGEHAQEGIEHLSYLRQQLLHLRELRQVLNAAQFVEG